MILNSKTTSLLLSVFIVFLLLHGTSHGQSNKTAKSGLIDIELAFGIDSEAEDKATNDMAVCMREQRWRDLAVVCSNAFQRWPKEQYFEGWITALERFDDPSSLADLCRSCMDRFPERRPSLYYRWTSAMRRANRVKETITQLTEQTKKDPKDVGAWRCLASELLAEKRYDDAVGVLRESSEYTDEHSRFDLTCQIVHALESKGDIPAAILAAEQAVSTAADRKTTAYQLTSAASLLARLLKKTGQVESWMSEAEKNIDPKAPDRNKLRILAEVATAAGDNATSLKYRRIMAETGSDKTSLLKLREVLERTGATNEEVAIIEKIMAADNAQYRNRELTERLAVLYASTGGAARACALMEDVVADSPYPETYAKACSIALRAGDKERANRWIDEAIKKNPQGSAMQTVALQLIAMGRHKDAIEIAFPAKTARGSYPDYYLTPIVQAMLKDGKTNMVLDRLTQQAEAQSTNAPAWRQLATFHQEARDFTNAAACWKKVVELAPNNAYDFQCWIGALDRTDDLDARMRARQTFLKAHPKVAAGMNYQLFDLARAMERSGRTNEIVAISDTLLEDRTIDVAHENIARILAKMGLIDRAARHLQAGIDRFESQGLIPQGQFLRNQLIDLYVKNGRGDDVLRCLEDMAKRNGSADAHPSTFKRCADVIGPERWKAITEAGEAPDATTTQQVLAVFMLTGSNEYARARAVLERLYAATPSDGVFAMLKSTFGNMRDKDASLALQLKHLERNPSLGRNQSYVVDTINAYVGANPSGGVQFARQAVSNFPSDSYVAPQAANLLLKAGCGQEAVTVYTNLIAKGNGGYAYARLAGALEEMGRTPEAVVVAFYAKSKTASSYDGAEAGRVLDRIAKKQGLVASVATLAETAMQGKPVNCPYADSVEWPALLAWAAERNGDYAKALAFHRKTYDKNQTPAAGRALAALLFKSGSPDEAISVQTRALKDAPRAEKQTARMELIRMMLADQRYDKVGSVVDEALADSPDAAIRKQLDDIRGEVDAGLRQQAFVQKATEKAIANPSDVAAQRSAAQALRLIGRHAKAAEFYRLALAIDDQTATRWDLAYVLVSARQHNEAIKEYEILLGRDISDQERDSVIKAIAESYDALGNPKQTLEFLTARVDDIKTANVRKWANARIKALREGSE